MTLRIQWGKAEDAILALAIEKSNSIDEAVALATRELGLPVTRHAIDFRLKRISGDTLQTALMRSIRERSRATSTTTIGKPQRATGPAPTPSTHAAPVGKLEVDETPGILESERETTPRTPAAEPPRIILDDDRDAKVDHARFAQLFALAKKHTAKKIPLTLERLCNALSMTPRDAQALVADAIDAGYSLDILEGGLEYKPPQPSRVYVPIAAAFEPGQEQLIGVASDWHVSSKHFERDAFCRHIDFLIESGCTDIMAPGDLVSGGYRFLRYEVARTGIEGQSEECAELLASRWGAAVRWHAIAGNHDESFDVGIDAARMVQRHMQERGLQNFHYHGARGARLLLGNTRIELWHPGGSLSYALTYKAQRHIDATAPQDRPHVLLVGHYHQSITFRRGGVWCVLCGTFENGDSSFGRMIGGDVALGGWILRYRMGTNGRIAEWSPSFREYPQTTMEWRAA
jgi:predicted phosphodiesterase